jgi:hypothetical protein
VSKNHRTVAAKVTSELNIHLEDPVCTQIFQRELHKSNIHGRAAIAKSLITENKAKRQDKCCDDQKTWTADDWKYVMWWRVVLHVVTNIRPGLCLESAQGSL